jgi:hypothetical protein
MTRTIGDDLTAIITTIYTERNPIERLAVARYAEQLFLTELRRLKQDAAYEARATASSADIADELGMDRKAVDYLVHRYMELNPHKEKPAYRSRGPIEQYVDLSQGNDHHSRQADTRTSQS